MSHPKAASQSFELISSLTTDGPDQTINTDNFSGLVTLLDDFASSTGIAVEAQQRQGRRKEPLTSAKYHYTRRLLKHFC